MSSIIPDVPDLPVDESLYLPEGTTRQTSAQTVWIGVPGEAGEPGILNLDGVGTTEFGSGTQNYNFVAGSGPENIKEPIEIGNVVDPATGQTVNAAGSIFQIADDYEGPVTVNLSNAPFTGATVDTGLNTIGDAQDIEVLPDGTNINIFDAGTIAENAPTPISDEELQFSFYVKTGAANDQIQGSDGDDFIRGGAGNDKINSGAGNDLVRPGANDDIVTLGPGDDRFYLTVDQLQGSSKNIIVDFDLDGDDTIVIAENLKGLVNGEVLDKGLGSKTIVIELGGAQPGTTEIVSAGSTIDDEDVVFS